MKFKDNPLIWEKQLDQLLCGNVATGDNVFIPSRKKSFQVQSSSSGVRDVRNNVEAIDLKDTNDTPYRSSQKATSMSKKQSLLIQRFERTCNEVGSKYDKVSINYKMSKSLYDDRTEKFDKWTNLLASYKAKEDEYYNTIMQLLLETGVLPEDKAFFDAMNRFNLKPNRKLFM